MNTAVRVLLTFAILIATGSPQLRGDQQQKRMPWLGMGVAPQVDMAGARFLHVQKTTKDGPADRAGIRPGDIITGLRGASLQIGDDLDFLLFLAERKPGERLAFHVVRAGRAREIVVTVGVMPESARAGWGKALHAARQKRIASERAQQ